MSASIVSRIGEQLRPIRHGLGSLACNRPEFAGVLTSIHLTSDAFEDHGAMPVQFTSDGEGVSPPLGWEGVPAEAAALVLLVEDPDAPFPKPLVHAIAPSLPVGNGRLLEGELPNQRRSELAEKMGRNSFAGRAWLPPSPPPGHGPHRYCFQLFALDIHPEFRDPPGRTALLRAMQGHVLAIGKLIGTYERA